MSVQDGETAPESAYVSVEQIVKERAEREAPAEQNETPPLRAETEELQSAAPSAAEAGREPEEVNAEGDEIAEQEVEAAEPSIDAPHFWEAEGKVKFAALPREMQEVIVAQDRRAQAAVTRAQEQAAEVSKAYQVKQQQLDAKIEGLSRFVSEREQALKRYDGVNWLSELENAGSDPELVQNVNWHKANYERLQAEAAEAEKAIAAADEEQLAASMRDIDERLPLLAPDLADKEHGPARVRALREFIVSGNIAAAEEIPYATPEQLSAMWDAYRWRASQQRSAKARAAPAAKPKPVAKPTVAPSSTAGKTAPSSSRLAALKDKSELSEAEFIEIRRLKRQAQK